MSEQLHSLKVSIDVLDAVRKRAKNLGMSMSNYADRLIRMSLDIHVGRPVAEFEALHKYSEKAVVEEEKEKNCV